MQFFKKEHIYTVQDTKKQCKQS